MPRIRKIDYNPFPSLSQGTRIFVQQPIKRVKTVAQQYELPPKLKQLAKKYQKHPNRMMHK